MVHFQKIWIMVLDSIYWKRTGGHESTKLNYQLFRKCSVSVIVIVGNRMEMVTNLFAGFLSNASVWVRCGTDAVLWALLKNTTDPARDWKWNQILVTHFNEKNIQFACGKQYLSPDSSLICFPSSSIIDYGNVSDVVLFIPHQQHSLLMWVSWYVCACAGAFVSM